jgi:hypothetical protein
LVKGCHGDADYLRVRLLYTGGLLVWMACVGFGLVRLWAYETGPGQAATAPAAWPMASHIPAPDGRPTLVLFVHPQCSCSYATINELDRMKARVRDAARTYIVMLAPFGTARDWVRSPLYRAAASIDGVTMIDDARGEEARRFGAATSGQALLYDAGGRLRFSGGITGSRGHEGDNAGRSTIEALLMARRAELSSTFVFGCALFESAHAAPDRTGDRR